LSFRLNKKVNTKNINRLKAIHDKRLENGVKTKKEKKNLQIGKKNLKASIAMLVVAALLVGTIAGAVLYTLTVPMQFRVSLALGLELWNVDKTSKITSITWADFSRGETQSQTFYILNTGNKDANVTLVLGDYDTTAWLITSSFTDQLVGKGDWSTAFDITITEINAVSDGYYGCDLAFEIVDHFELGYEPKAVFNPDITETSYRYATATYLQYVGNTFNASEYGLGKPVGYSFETRDIYATGTVIGWQYSLYVKDSLGNTVATVKDHYTVTCNMSENDIWTETLTFAAPSTAGTYHMNVTYELADWSPPIETPITWTISIVNPFHPTISIENPHITGATQTNEVGTIWFTIVYGGGESDYNVVFTVTVLDSDNNLVTTIAEATTPPIPPLGGSYSYNHEFTMTQGGSLTMLITITGHT
jgi:hypothetical protein